MGLGGRRLSAAAGAVLLGSLTAVLLPQLRDGLWSLRRRLWEVVIDGDPSTGLSLSYSGVELSQLEEAWALRQKAGP
ncbi:hypothetical protein chiPu_0028440, partial [Chiloscyllium punctatum]|nr:hypothetical protein [Chiloscyllium punctatum]